MAPKNLLEVFFESVSRFRHRPCFRYAVSNGKTSWKTMSWLEASDAVREIASGLKARGIQRGDRVAIISATRYEWTLCDLAILSLGGVTVPIYPSVTADQASYILEDSEAHAIFVENEAQAEKIKLVRERLPQLKEVIRIDSSLEELRHAGVDESEEEWEEGISKIGVSDVATIVYTSGTTGAPKGAVLTHGNFVSEVEALTKVLDLCEQHVGLIFLPLAHIFARVVQFWQLRSGCVHAYAQSIETVISDVQAIRPHFFASVPRIFEKIHEQVQAKLESAPRFKKKLLTTVGKGLVHRKIRSLFGPRLRFAISGGGTAFEESGGLFLQSGCFDSRGVWTHRDDRRYFYQFREGISVWDGGTSAGRG